MGESVSKRRVIILGVVALLVAGGGIVGFKVIRDRDNASAMCNMIAEQRAKQGVVTQVTAGVKTVAVIGDSYSSGYDIPDLSRSWENAVGRDENWTTKVAAVSTSGLINPGACGDSAFSGRVEAIKAVHPEMLIVQDGLNDLDADPAKVKQAAVDLLDQFPGVNRVVIGPNAVPGKNHLAEIDAALAAASAQVGARYVSTLGWVLELKTDGHMTEKGHQQYASNLEKVLPLTRREN